MQKAISFETLWADNWHGEADVPTWFLGRHGARQIA